MQLTHSLAVLIERAIHLFASSPVDSRTGSRMHDYSEHHRDPENGRGQSYSLNSPGGQGSGISPRLDMQNPMISIHHLDVGSPRSSGGGGGDVHGHMQGMNSSSSSSSSSSLSGASHISTPPSAWQKIQSFFCCCKVLLLPCRVLYDTCLVPGKCLADAAYPSLLLGLCYSPTYGAGIFLVIYIVFTILFIPFWLLSLIVTPMGATFTLVALVVLACRALARFLAFPGSSKALQRELSSDYLKRLVVQIHDFAALSAQHAIAIASHTATHKQLGVVFNITGENSGGQNGAVGSGADVDGSGSGRHVVKKTVELAKWVEAVKKLHLYLGVAIEEFRHVHAINVAATGADVGNRSSSSTGSVSIATAGATAARELAYEPSRRVPLTLFSRFVVSPVLRLFALLDNNARVGNPNFSTAAGIGAVIDPMISVHHVLGSLIICASILVSYVGEHAEMYSPNDTSLAKRIPKSKSGVSYPGTDSGVGAAGAASAIVNTIGLTVRTAEALRASLQYVLERSTHDGSAMDSSSSSALSIGLLSRLAGMALSANGNGGGGTQGIISSICRTGEGPTGPANLSSFVMRAQLLGTHKGVRFTVIGNDGNRIDCVLIPGKRSSSSSGKSSAEREREKEKRKKKEKDSKQRRSTNRSASTGVGSSSGSRSRTSGDAAANRFNNDQEDASYSYDSDDTVNTTSSVATAESSKQVHGVGGAGGAGASANLRREAEDAGSANEDARLRAYGASADNQRSAAAKSSQGTGAFGHAASDGQTSSASASLPSSSSVAGDSAAFRPSPYGAVLYCGPNAGMYEAFSMIPDSSSWLSYYTATLGMDVVLHNYRGYGMSTGVPSPDRLKADGVAVYDYVRNVLGISRLVVHGESVGGMVANHVAATDACAMHFASDIHKKLSPDAHARTSSYSSGNNGDGVASDDSDTLLSRSHSGGGGGNYGDVEMNMMNVHSNQRRLPSGAYGSASSVGHSGPIVRALVCDRTFSSLDAVAGRLLGSWASAGLWYLGCWYTNSVVDFLDIPGADRAHLSDDAEGQGQGRGRPVSNVVKIVIQDPEDRIVFHAASMQEGVSSVLSSGILGAMKKAGDFTWWPSHPEPLYALPLFKGDIPVVPELSYPFPSRYHQPSSDPYRAVNSIPLTLAQLKLCLPAEHDVCACFAACVFAICQQAQLGRVREIADQASAHYLAQTDSSMGGVSSSQYGSPGGSIAALAAGAGAGTASSSLLTSNSFHPSVDWLKSFCSQSVRPNTSAATAADGLVGSTTSTPSPALASGQSLHPIRCDADLYRGGAELSLLEKVLIVLFRTDNGAGSTLGEVFIQNTHPAAGKSKNSPQASAAASQSVGSGRGGHGSLQEDRTNVIGFADRASINDVFEAVRIWMHTALAFSGRVLRGDAKNRGLSSAFPITLSECSLQLKCLCEEHELEQHAASKQERGHGLHGANFKSSAIDAMSLLIYAMCTLQAFSQAAVGEPLHVSPCGSDQLGDGASQGGHSSSASSSSASASAGAGAALTSNLRLTPASTAAHMYSQSLLHTRASAAAGFLIPVHCGHSGWPGTKAVIGVSILLGKAGFDIPSSAVPAMEGVPAGQEFEHMFI